MDLEKNQNNYVFTKKNWKQNKHMPKTWLLYPIKEIVINAENIQFFQNKKYYKYSWKDIRYSKVICKKNERDLTIKDKTCVIVTKDDIIFQFNVSLSNPDFNNNNQLLNLLKDKLNLHEFVLPLPNFWQETRFFLIMIIVINIFLIKYGHQ